MYIALLVLSVAVLAGMIVWLMTRQIKRHKMKGYTFDEQDIYNDNRFDQLKF